MSARDDYPTHPHWPTAYDDAHGLLCDEIDRLRSKNTELQALVDRLNDYLPSDST